MRALAFIALLLVAPASSAADWLIASPSGRAEAGARFEILVAAPPREPLPEELTERLKVDVAEIVLELKATGPARVLLGRCRCFP